MARLLNLPAEKPVAVAASAEEVSAPVDVPVEEKKPKGRRGRPPKTEEATTEAADTSAADTSSTTVDASGVEYEDVEEKITAADLRAACIAAVDRSDVATVQNLLRERYNTVVAAEVPADKLNEAFKMVEAVGKGTDVAF
jgi:hypothetical protein